MSRTTSFSPRAATFSGSAQGPAGLGALNVPSSSQRSCQEVSICCAIAAVYRNGFSDVCSLMSSLSSLLGLGKRKPLAQEGKPR